MNPLPLILSAGLAAFAFTGPVGKPFAMIAALALGWNAGIYYAASRIAPSHQGADDAAQ